MADFLSRLIQRVSGEATGIRPLVRSGYGTFLRVNESATEFEETVIFNDDAGPVSRTQIPPVSPVQSPGITRKTDIHDTQEIIKTGAKPEIQLTPDTSRASIRRESQLYPGSSPENEDLVTSERETGPNDIEETLSEKGARNRDELTDTPTGQTIRAQPIQDSERDIKATNQTSLVFRGTPAAPPGNRQVSDKSPQIPAPERTDIRQPDIIEVVEATQLISPDISLRERDFPRKLETEGPAEPTRQVNLARQYRPEEASPSMNIRVTIGRVEIKAVQQSEPEIQRTPSVPVAPAISLDAYLKSRDEEAR
jgi:hypothetical protein